MAVQQQYFAQALTRLGLVFSRTGPTKKKEFARKLILQNNAIFLVKTPISGF
jgi:hypothetical protein